jgi:hypothetical protein
VILTFAVAGAFLPAAFAAGKASLAVAETGALHNLGWPGWPQVSELFLMIPKTGWSGSLFTQETWKPDHFDAAPDGSSWHIAGRATWDGGGMDIDETVRSEPGKVSVVYKLRFSADTSSEGIMLFMRTPTADLAGKGRVLEAARKHAFVQNLPAALPDPYHIGGLQNPLWIAWMLGDNLTMVRPDGNWIGVVSIQDDRKWGMPSFEAQLLVRDGHVVRAGQEVVVALTITPATKADLDREGVVIVEPQGPASRLDFTSKGEPSLGQAVWSSHEGPRFKPVELRFPVTGSWDNPFDPDQVDVSAVITTPSGRSLTQPAFIYYDFDLLTDADFEVVRPNGKQDWRVRWTPTEEGPYRVRLVARTGGKRLTREAGSFACHGALGRGFIRRSPSTPFYLRFDDGAPYFAIGENICWDGDNVISSYRRWFSRLGAASGNYTRIWLCRWNMGLEWNEKDGRGAYYGLGRYSPDNAFRLDKVLEAAADNGIYCMLCLGYHGELMDSEGYFHEDCWKLNPYNAALGGPCAKPADFWTNPDARRLYKQRLRYYLARYGCYTNILSFELWNEVFAPAPWVREMSEFLGENDLNHHLRTTTYGDDAVWALDSMDYVQAHHYGSDDALRDSAPPIADTSFGATEKYKKPFMMGEFGIDWKRGDNDHDPKGLATNMHNGLWAAVASRSFGTASIWYWDGYVDPLNLYPQFDRVARFARMIDWTRFNPARPKVEPLSWVTPPAHKTFGDLLVSPAWEWRRQPDAVVPVNSDGTLGGAPTCLLFAPFKPDLHSPMKLRLSVASPGQLKLLVSQVSSLSVLVVKLDGAEILRREFKCGPPGEGRYKKTEWREQWKIWQSVFDEEVAVDLPAGDHVLELSNVDGDWMTIPKITLPGVRDLSVPRVDTCLLADRGLAIAWLHDRESNWQNDLAGKAPEEVAPLRLIFSGLRDGRYEALWYDTWAGVFSEPKPLTVGGGRVELTTPQFKRDVALIIRPRK